MFRATCLSEFSVAMLDLFSIVPAWPLSARESVGGAYTAEGARRLGLLVLWERASSLTGCTSSAELISLSKSFDTLAVMYSGSAARRDGICASRCIGSRARLSGKVVSDKLVSGA